MIDIINNKLYKNGDEIYFITSSVDKPHLYIKCFGIIKSRIIKNDNVLYGIKLRKVFISPEVAKLRIHRRTFRTRKNDTEFAVNKKLYCLECLENNESVSQGVSNLLRHHLMIVPSVFMKETLYELDSLYEKSTEIILQKLKKSINEIGIK